MWAFANSIVESSVARGWKSGERRDARRVSALRATARSGFDCRRWHEAQVAMAAASHRLAAATLRSALPARKRLFPGWQTHC